MNVCNWCMSGSATENSILLSVLPRLNKIFIHSFIQMKLPTGTFNSQSFRWSLEFGSGLGWWLRSMCEGYRLYGPCRCYDGRLG